jgi:hypothetical protein
VGPRPRRETQRTVLVRYRLEELPWMPQGIELRKRTQNIVMRRRAQERGARTTEIRPTD